MKLAPRDEVVEIAEGEIKLHHMYDWQEIFPSALRYKKPFILNGHLFTERPSPDGTLPDGELDNDGQAEELLTDTSEDTDTEVEEVPAQEEVKTGKLREKTEQELHEEARAKARAEKLKANPLAPLPDVTKFDKVFMLPVFMKPGKH